MPLQSTSVGPPLELYALAWVEELEVEAGTPPVTVPPILPLPLAVPLPDIDTDVVTLAVDVLAVLDALAEFCAIALLAPNIRPSSRQEYITGVRIFIDSLSRDQMALTNSLFAHASAGAMHER